MPSYSAHEKHFTLYTLVYIRYYHPPFSYIFRCLQNSCCVAFNNYYNVNLLRKSVQTANIKILASSITSDRLTDTSSRFKMISDTIGNYQSLGKSRLALSIIIYFVSKIYHSFSKENASNHMIPWYQIVISGQWSTMANSCRVSSGNRAPREGGLSWKPLSPVTRGSAFSPDWRPDLARAGDLDRIQSAFPTDRGVLEKREPLLKVEGALTAALRQAYWRCRWSFRLGSARLVRVRHPPVRRPLKASADHFSSPSLPRPASSYSTARTPPFGLPDISRIGWTLENDCRLAENAETANDTEQRERGSFVFSL